MGNTSTLVRDEAPVIQTAPLEAAQYQPRYRSPDAHHLQLLVCRPFESNESPFENCKIRYIKESRFFVFDLLKNSSDITFNHVIQCVKLASELVIATNNGVFGVSSYTTGMYPIKGLEGQNIIDFDDSAEYFLTADGNVFFRERNTVQLLPYSELGGHPITKMICEASRGYYATTSKLFFINDQNELIARDIKTQKNEIIKLQNDSRVVHLHLTVYGSLYTVHIMCSYSSNDPNETEYNLKKIIANHNIVKMDGSYSELYFQTDKGQIIPLYIGGKPTVANELDNVRVSDFQATPMFTYIDTRGDILIYNRYKGKIEFMDRGSGYFSFLVNADTKVKATQDCIFIYVTRDARRRNEMLIMHRQASQTHTLIDVDIITLH